MGSKDENVELGKGTQMRAKIIFDGSENVQMNKMDKEDFELPTSDHIAEYSSEDLSGFWNTEHNHYNGKISIFKRIWRHFKEGLWGKTAKMIIIYLIVYYIINITIIQILCARSHDMAFKTFICLDYDRTFKDLVAKETDFTRILTFLLGFYVSFTIGRWWKQVTSIPRIDSICLSIGGFVWCDRSKNDRDVYVEDGMSVKQFKQTIVRYCLLSWTMCMSMVSPPLRDKFYLPEHFTNKRLMTFNEYKKLKTIFKYKKNK